MKVIGSKITEARRRANMTQRELADAVGVTVQAVSQWENNKTDASGRLDALSTALRIDRDFLVGGRTSSPSILDDMRLRSDFDVPIVDIEAIADRIQLGAAVVEFTSEMYVASTVRPVGKLFASYATSDSAYYRKDDLMIFDSGIDPIEGDICAVVLLQKQQKVIRMAEAQSFLVGSPGAFAWKGGGENGPLVVLTSDGVHSDTIAVVGTMVEHRTFRRPQMT